MFEGISLSDLHFTGLDKHFVDADDRIFAEMEKIYQYAVKRAIKYVVMPGDLSDRPHIPTDTYIKLFLFLKKYDDLVTTIYIAGNHDFDDIEHTSMNFLEVLSREKALKNTKIYLKPARTEIEGVPINFLPYPCLKSLSTNSGSLNFAHVEYTGAIGDNGRKLKTKKELETHPDDFTISGHIHQYQYLKEKRAIYVGNPFQKNFGEKLPKGFIHFKAYVKKGRVMVEHEFIENKPNFTLVNLQINDVSDFKKIKNDDSIRYKLHIDPEVAIPPDLLIKYPNITGGLFTNLGKRATSDDVDEEKSVKPKSKVNIYTGLKNFLVSNGVKNLKEMKTEVDIACNKLGIQK